MHVVVDALFARQQGDAQRFEVLYLVQQHCLFSLTKAFQNAGVGQVEFEVAHHLTALQPTVNQRNFS